DSFPFVHSLFFPLTRDRPLLTLFPYTTLFRSWRARSTIASWRRWSGPPKRSSWATPPTPARRWGRSPLIAASSTSTSSFKRRSRSEEHTSELQSLAYLVCRLLLEKKNNHLLLL